MFSFLYHWQNIYRTWLYMWVSRRVSYKKQELLTLREHMSSPQFDFVVGPVSFYIFCVVLICVVTFWVPCCDVRYDFSIKQCSVRFYPQLDVRGLVSYLHYLCLLAHSGVKHILCCAFALFFFVLCTLCRQFPWIVHFWLPLRYSLTFNYYGV